MKRFALFIGINSYAGSSLSCARADAEALHREFASRYDVARLLVDRQATSERIEEEVELIRRMARSGDMFVFFFSGHGSDRGSERLLCIPERDSRGRPRESEIFSTETLRQRTDIKGLHRLFILDCCRVRDDGGGDVPEWAWSVPKAPAYVLRHGGRSVIRPTLLSSSSPGQHAYENPARGHGYFTDAFLEALRDPSVHDFNQFRDRLDAIMSAQDKPADQDPYFEGPIGSDLPIWPDWYGEPPAVPLPLPPPPSPRKRRRRPTPPPATPHVEPDAFAASLAASLAAESPPAAPAVPPHVVEVRTPAGHWAPEPGYVWKWTDSDSPRPREKITPVEWKRNRPLRGHEHVVASRREGEWEPEPGWGFVAEHPFDFRVRWVPGSPCHEWLPNVVATRQTGYWVPAPGYVWLYYGTTEPRPMTGFGEELETVRRR